MAKERWRPIEGYEEIAEISDQGRVRHISDTWRRKAGSLYPLNWRSGYLAVSLMKDGKSKRISVHILVMKTFGPPQPPNTEVDHENRDRSYNYLVNLRWLTRTLNNRNRSSVKLTYELAQEIRTRIGSHQQLADEYAVSRRLIGLIKQEKIWLNASI